MKKKQVTIRIENDMYDKLKNLAKSEGLSFSALTRKLLYQYYSEKEKKNEKNAKNA